MESTSENPFGLTGFFLLSVQKSNNLSPQFAHTDICRAPVYPTDDKRRNLPAAVKIPTILDLKPADIAVTAHPDSRCLPEHEIGGESNLHTLPPDCKRGMSVGSYQPGRGTKMPCPGATRVSRILRTARDRIQLSQAF